MSDEECKGLEHGSTVVVCTDDSELFYVLKWAEREGKDFRHVVYCIEKFPFCIATAGDRLGWTDLMDRALYYMPFSEFIHVKDEVG